MYTLFTTEKSNPAPLKTVSFWVTVALLMIPASEFSAELTSYLNANDFGECVASLIQQSGESKYLSDRQAFAEKSKKYLLENSKQLEPMKKLMYPFNKISIEANLASLPLVDDSKTPEDNARKVPLTSLLFATY